jgi:molybdopterin synthase sulfur carrier subunit
MTVRLLAFAQAADHVGFRERAVVCKPEDTARQLLQRVAADYDPAHARVAIDGEYRDWDEPIGTAEELAIIPPVSGG